MPREYVPPMSNLKLSDSQIVRRATEDRGPLSPLAQPANRYATVN